MVKQVTAAAPYLTASTAVPMAVVIPLSLYFLCDLSFHLFQYAGEAVPRANEWRVATFGGDFRTGGSQHEPGCETIEDFIEDGDYYNPTAVEDPWRQLKWTLPPAKCRVKGELIERLDPLYNYRRGFALRLTGDLDDKTHIEHWFLGTRVDLNKRKRRVLIDLGANDFTTSVLWFSLLYPCDFTEVHAFEAKKGKFVMPEGWDEESNSNPPGTPGFWKVKSRDGAMPKWMLQRIHPYNQLVGVVDDEAKQSVNITRFIKDELKLTADDAVIVKMDIEGYEWPILEEWRNDPEMPLIIDELWTEFHYYEPPDNDWVGMKDYSRERTTRIIAELRFKGWYVHYWD